MRVRSLPHNLVLEVIFPKHLVKHLLDVVAGVPVAVIVKATRLLEHPRQFHTAGPHEVDIRLCRFVAIFKGPLLFRLAPKDFVIAVRVERRVDVYQRKSKLCLLDPNLEVVDLSDAEVKAPNSLPSIESLTKWAATGVVVVYSLGFLVLSLH